MIQRTYTYFLCRQKQGYVRVPIFALSLVKDSIDLNEEGKLPFLSTKNLVVEKFDRGRRGKKLESTSGLKYPMLGVVHASNKDLCVLRSIYRLVRIGQGCFSDFAPKYSIRVIHVFWQF